MFQTRYWHLNDSNIRLNSGIGPENLLNLFRDWTREFIRFIQEWTGGFIKFIQGLDQRIYQIYSGIGPENLLNLFRNWTREFIKFIQELDWRIY